MDNRPDPKGVVPPSQLDAPPPPPTDFDSNPEMGTPGNPNAGLASVEPASQSRRLDAVRHTIAQKPVLSIGLAALAGLGLTMALQARRA